MDKGLIKSLLKIYHSEASEHTIGKAVREFVEQYEIGRWHNTRQWSFAAKDKALLAALLQSSCGVDAANTTPTQWDALSRSESLTHGRNEKMAGLPVRGMRVAVKALADQCLLFDDQRFPLPLGASLDIEAEWVASHCRHSSILLVENWEAFSAIHRINFELSVAGGNPLVVFKGCPHIYKEDAVQLLLKQLALPVYAFFDFDPKGLVMANSVPHFSRLVMPSWSVLEASVQQAKNPQRFNEHLANAMAVLDAASHPDIVACWQLLKQYGYALPQEFFIGNA